MANTTRTFALMSPGCSSSVSDHKFEVVQHPAQMKLRPMVKRFGASVTQAKSSGRATQQVVGKNRKKKGKRKQARKSPKGKRGWLSNVSAETVSLQDAADFVGAVWKYGSYALGMFNTEVKESYTLQSNAIVTNATLFNVVAIAQGSDYNQRTGDTIKVENLRLEYTLQVNSTATMNETRIVVLRDFMCQGAFPATTDIFQDTSTNAAMIISPFLHSLGDRFEVLSDVVHMQTLSTESAFLHKRFGYGINDHMLFKGTSAAIGDCWQGMIFLVVVTDQGTNGPKLVASTLLTYVDN